MQFHAVYAVYSSIECIYITMTMTMTVVKGACKFTLHMIILANLGMI